MSKYYINQKFAFKDYFTIKDENLEDVFIAEGDFLTVSKKIRIKTMDDEEILLIKERFLTFLARYEFFVGSELVGEMKRNFTLFKRSYEITDPNWHITGDFWDYNYEIMNGTEQIARISKKWLSFMDAYEIDLLNEDYLELVLGIVIAIDIDLLRDSQSQS